MKSKLLVVLLFLFTIQVFSQNKKWSIEANYPIIPGDEFPGDYNGFLDLGVKYRFVNLGIFQIGAGLNSGLLLNRSRLTSNLDIDGRVFYIQPTFFGQLNLNRLHPFLGVGYSFWNEDVSGSLDGENFIDVNDSNGGLNINLGTSFNITKRIFLNAQYDFTSLRFNNTIEVDGQDVKLEGHEDFGLIKLGIGIRF